jgi:hypothetical protein
LLLLAATVGAPYLLLSTTGPLLQSWYASISGGESPYRLYALSNVGSLLALLSYPFLFEPHLSLRWQSRLWTGGFFAFVVACVGCGALVARRGRERERGAAAATERDVAATVVLWVGLSACGSALLLATTSQLCQDVAVIPFLWVLPLAIYLLSFIIAFDSPRWYVRGVFVPALVVTTVAGAVVLVSGTHLEDQRVAGITIPALAMQAAAYALLLFSGCMVCHGELARAKPPPERLTRYFMFVAFGGALGGAFVSLVAPRVFDGIWELHLAVLGAWVLLGWSWLRDVRSRPGARRPVVIAKGVGVVAFALAIVAGSLYHRHTTFETVIASARNFYGVLRVKRDTWGPDEWRRTLAHGRITHGLQFEAAIGRELPVSYYSRLSGIGLALDEHPRRSQPTGAGLRIGVVGLGVGTIAAYARAGDTLRFYEINPDVLEFAEEHFSYLGDARARGADVEVWLGDARILLERQLAQGEEQRFDVLAVDAFSGDAVPVHLLTAECNALYWKHLKDDGILAIHVSNHYLDLKPVVRKLAEVAGKEAHWFEVYSDTDAGVAGSDWILTSDNAALWQNAHVSKLFRSWPVESPDPLLWTDDDSAMLPLVK